MLCAGQVEIDPFCTRVLEKHWPHVLRWKDIKNERNYEEYPAVDLVCGGYPCQGESLAGKRKGPKDNRWLWPYVFKVVQRLRPSWCLFENVIGHVTLGLDEVLADLESAGYATGPVIIPACAVDAPHRRDRVWIIANTYGSRRKECNAAAITARPGFDTGISSPDSFPDTDGDNQLRGCLHEQMGRLGFERKAKADGNPGGIKWPVEPGVGRVAHGVPSRVDRLKGLGNAVVPELVMEIGLAIIAAEGDAV